MTTTNPLEHIAYEDIDDTYCYGKYGKFTVIMMKKNGYINATKMCQLISKRTGTKKTFKNWNKNSASKELIEAISSMDTIISTELFKTVKGGNNRDVWGTYVHPKLIPQIAQWASPVFALKVSDIINDYFNNKELKKKNRLLHEKDDKIGELTVEIHEQNIEMRKQTAKIDKLLHKNKRITHKLTNIEEQNEEMAQQNDELIISINQITPDRVIKSDDKDNQHTFVIMKDATAQRHERYYAIRTKKRTMKSAIKRYKTRHPACVKILEISYNPNSINLWDRCKENLKRHIDFRQNNFGLKRNYTETELINDINDINDEKLNV